MIRADSMSADVWESMCTPMHEIIPSAGRTGGLFLGSWAASVDSDLLATHRIRTIVEVHDSPWGSTSTSASVPSTPFGSANSRAPPPLVRSASSYGMMQQTNSGGTSGISAGAPDQIVRYKIAIADSADADVLRPHLDGAVRFIKERMALGENVLVHCQQGISRSPAIVLAFLMRDRGLTYDAALKFIRSKRKCAKPNTGFERTLREWESSWRR